MKTLLTFLLTVTAAFAAEQADVVVVAATPGGIAAAVSAARSGSNVILLEEKSHVGGIVSGGLTNTDIYKKAAVGGLFAEFVKRVREHYVTTSGENSEQVKVCQGGHMFEAKVAEKVFRDMLVGVPYRVGRESRETFGERHARCSAQTSRSAWGRSA